MGTAHGYVTPQFAAATMHNNLAENAREIAHGNSNVPIHPAQVPSEGSDTQETEGDSVTRAGGIVIKTAKPRGTPG